MTAELVPDFIVGGAPRSGTTYLAHALDTHPDIEMAKPWRPEPKVFLRPADGAAVFRAQYAQWFGPEHAAVLRGEKTTNYFESAEAPARVATALPEVRLVFLLREPVARAYSNWLWSRMNGLEDLPFAEAIELEGDREDPLPEEQAHARPHDYLGRGDYARFGRRWFDALGQERVGFWLYEDLFTRTSDVLESIQDFVGAEPRPLPGRPGGLVNEARSTGAEIDPELEAQLRERMAPLVNDLADLTGLDLSPWRY
jgi:hypothetical protein